MPYVQQKIRDGQLAGIDLRTNTNLREKEKRQDVQAKRQKYDAEFFKTICLMKQRMSLKVRI